MNIEPSRSNLFDAFARHGLFVSGSLSRSVLTATVLLASVAMAGCSSSAPPTFTATGAVVISIDGDQVYEPAAEPPDGEMPVVKTVCEGAGGNADITAGTQVLIRNGAGKLLAVGELDPGVVDAEKSTCSFALTVAGVKNGLPFYSLEVAHRGTNHYTAAKIKAPLSVNLSSVPLILR